MSTVYGIVSAGRKWQRKSDEIVLEALKLEAVIGVPQLFVKFDASRQLIALLAKYVDDLVIATKEVALMNAFREALSQELEIGSWKQVPEEMDVNGTNVLQTAEMITVTAENLVRSVDCVELSPGRRKDISSECTSVEVRKVRTMAGKLGYLGVSISPLASFAASFIQQIVPKITVAGVKHSNGITRDVLKRSSQITYLRPSPEEVEQTRLVVFSDAGFPHNGLMKRVAQEDCLFGIAFGEKSGCKFHTLGWMSRKQR